MEEGFFSGGIMNYIKITPCDVANGPGVRTVLWTAGCTHHCPGCHNPETWNPTAGKPWEKADEKMLFDALSKPFVKGITFSGGDPMHEKNVRTVLRLIQKIRESYPMKTIWLYTGYVVEDIFAGADEEMKIRAEIVSLCDVVVDGRYVATLRNITLPYCGSENQRVIDIAKSREANKIILFNKENNNG